MITVVCAEGAIPLATQPASGAAINSGKMARRVNITSLSRCRRLKSSKSMLVDAFALIGEDQKTAKNAKKLNKCEPLHIPDAAIGVE
ncbi:hypothetical protein [uncultured Roseobacter sp.]|uniref:hypothetical protein n=1 Tax=uncultured Roseobacter sp. TaxID=114847 RepID=UPI0026234EED|nr:hypothetical protein [uncultured Roseobacter sp.]